VLLLLSPTSQSLINHRHRGFQYHRGCCRSMMLFDCLLVCYFLPFAHSLHFVTQCPSSDDISKATARPSTASPVDQQQTQPRGCFCPVVTMERLVCGMREPARRFECLQLHLLYAVCSHPSHCCCCCCSGSECVSLCVCWCITRLQPFVYILLKPIA
jgi:hypothetical protein